MTKIEVKNVLSEHREELERFGVKTLELFGSLARGDQNTGSDIDLLVEFNRPVGLFAFYDLEEYIESLFPAHKLDLVMRGAVLEELREGIFAEAVSCL